jgi:hypothetical protein
MVDRHGAISTVRAGAERGDDGAEERLGSQESRAKKNHG